MSEAAPVRICADLGIEHRLAPPMRPQTNGMVQRFNGRIEDILQGHRFRSGEDLEQTILRYVRLYNGQLPQSVLKGRTPIAALKDWHRDKPALFKKRPYNHAGCDTSRVATSGTDNGDDDEHWVQIASTNPLERVNREIKCRADVIGIFPDDDAIVRLVGALMLETNDEWTVARRNMSLESLARMTDSPNVRLPAVAT